MPRQKTTVMINPDIMKWAIDNSGFDIGDIANELKVTDKTVNDWKTKNQEINIKKLEDLAVYIKRPLAVFFLKTPPQESKLVDYRKLSRQQTVKLSPKSIISIRRARYLQSRALELMELQRINPEPSIDKKITINTSPEIIAEHERKKLGFESQNAMPKIAKRSIWDFYNTLKNTIESFNIFVFQDSIAINEMRGLTLDKFPRIILINSRDSIHARIFSLLHEYGHILLRKDGMCVPQEAYMHNSDKSLQQIEKWCNVFAASILMPRQEFLSKYHKLRENELEIKEIINKLSGKFHASEQTTTIRMYNLEPMSLDFYKFKSILNEIAKDKTTKNEKKSMVPDIVNICISRKGRKFITLVLESKKDKIINNSDVIDCLGINLKHMQKLQEKIF